MGLNQRFIGRGFLSYTRIWLLLVLIEMLTDINCTNSQVNLGCGLVARRLFICSIQILSTLCVPLPR